jgi:glycosyltransferase A (GT-A) superfamily protein (DUF2064 family)
LAASFSIGALVFFWFIARLHAAALDHEVLDHAVENGAVVMAGGDVGEEVGDRLRRLLGVQIEQHDAVVGGEFDHGWALISRR